MAKEKLEIVDEIEWEHRDKYGKLIKRYKSKRGRLHKLLVKLHLKKPNCLTNDAFANIAGLLLSDVGGTAYDFMQIGTGILAEGAADIALGTPQSVRLATTGTRVTTGGITNNTSQWVCIFSQAIDATLTGTDAITEVGVFHTAIGDNVMLLRQTFAAESLNWDNGDTFTVTVKMQCKQGT